MLGTTRSPRLLPKGGDARLLAREVPTDATALQAHRGDVEETDTLKVLLDADGTYRARKVLSCESERLYEARLLAVHMNAHESLCLINK